MELMSLAEMWEYLSGYVYLFPTALFLSIIYLYYRRIKKKYIKPLLQKTSTSDIYLSNLDKQIVNAVSISNANSIAALSDDTDSVAMSASREYLYHRILRNRDEQESAQIAQSVITKNIDEHYLKYYTREVGLFPTIGFLGTLLGMIISLGLSGDGAMSEAGIALALVSSFFALVLFIILESYYSPKLERNCYVAIYKGISIAASKS